MRNSIGKKVIAMLAVLGIVLLAICFLNMSALRVIAGYSEAISRDFQEIGAAASSGDEARTQQL